MGADKWHEHFLLFPRDSAMPPSQLQPAQMLWHMPGNQTWPNYLSNLKRSSRERLIYDVIPLTMMDFSQGMSASQRPGLKLYMNKQNMWPSNSLLNKEGNSWAPWHSFRTDTLLTMNEVALLLPDEKGVSHCWEYESR